MDDGVESIMQVELLQTESKRAPAQHAPAQPAVSAIQIQKNASMDSALVGKKPSKGKKQRKYVPLKKKTKVEVPATPYMKCQDDPDCGKTLDGPMPTETSDLQDDPFYGR